MGDHPEPGAGSLAAADRLGRLIEQIGPGDTVWVLLSGGTTSLIGAPQLGIAELDSSRRFVIADIPGLIEGAAAGAGLGHDFLRHVERTRVLVHLLDVATLDGSKPADNSSSATTREPF